MEADHKATQFEDDKESTYFNKEPIGLQVTRKPIKDWSWKSLEETYELITQVGEGTFR